MELERLRTKLFRVKKVGGDFLETQMSRCLSTLDVTMLGIGHMIGAGIYVLTGAVVRNTAGPGIVLSFIFAGIASLLSALCYAEFGARVPKAGSAYTYTYVTVGEVWAFIIGWNVILEHMLGAAAVARSWSGYLDSLFSHFIKNSTIAVTGGIEHVGEKGEKSLLADYPDFVAFLVVIVVSAFTAYGAKTSSRFNNIFTVVNLAVITFVVIAGIFLADLNNWTNSDRGGFMPFGFRGVVAGAASCFFAYIGFDGLATAGEEASDPMRTIPRATFVSMSIVTACYVLMSASLTLMVPYTDVHPTAAFSDAFERRDWMLAKYIVAVGALSGMTTSMVGSMFALPRCVYAMAKDGLLFESLATIHPTTQVPTYAVVVFGAATAVISLLFDIETLVQFLSIGTLMAYTIVSGSVVILRYKPYPEKQDTINTADTDDAGLLDVNLFAGRPKPILEPLKWLTDKFAPGNLIIYCVAVYVLALLLFSALVRYGDPMVNVFQLGFIVLFALVAIAAFAIICGHHQNEGPQLFRVPLVPLIPCLSMLVNVILMLHLDEKTWIRLVIWLVVGLLIYFLYGIRHSKENEELGGQGMSYDTLMATPTTPGGETVKVPPTGEPMVSVERTQPPATN